jgi:hypothetical protein
MPDEPASYDEMLLALCEAVKAGADAYVKSLPDRSGTTAGAHAAAVRDLAAAYESVRPFPRPPSRSR